MLKQIYKNNLTLNYKDLGRGPVIVLIHGFIETLDIWEGFDKELAKSFRIISVDLPGHGNSDLHGKPYTMCKYAESIKLIIDHEKIDKVFIIGHSMGGYVGLAFLENFPVNLTALCLFHSSPFADNEQKKDNRNSTIEKIQLGLYKSVYETHMKAIFAEENVEIFKKEIFKAEKYAEKISVKSVIASIETMRDRKDRSELLSKCKVPFLMILGKKDNFIPYGIKDLITLPDKSEIILLAKSGHMGMIEEKEKSLNVIRNFYHNLIQ